MMDYTKQPDRLLENNEKLLESNQKLIDINERLIEVNNGWNETVNELMGIITERNLWPEGKKNGKM